jgi:uncharacterized protein YndB with AHSA1/START domain
MKVDVASQIGAVTRVVTAREHNGRPARAVIASRVYDTTIDDAWDALTNGERIPRWFLPISGDLRLGGRYQLEGNAGGTITECEPPRHLAMTWEYGGDVSWVDVKLSEDAGGTYVELEHIAHIDDDRWAEFGPGAVGVGWDLAIMGLDLHLRSGESADRPTAMAWMASDEGKAFMRGSSDEWCRASIAGGTDPAAAKAAAERTAAYTGEPPTGN